MSSPARHALTSLAAVALAIALVTGCASQQAEPPGTPAPTPTGTGEARAEAAAAGSAGLVDGWRTTTPRRAGFAPRVLDELAREAKDLDSTCYAVVRRGRLVQDWNWSSQRTDPREVFSVTKSVTSALVGIAARDGDLDLDDRVAAYVPQWRGGDSADVTVRQLLANDSGRFWSPQSDYITLSGEANRTRYAIGLDQQHPPGSAWAYNNAAIQVLDRVVRRATGTPTDEYAAARLFEPLGMSHSRLTHDTSGRSTNTYFGMQTTCLDLARFAKLYLDEGKVGDDRLLDRAFVRASVGRPATELNAAYGYLWWLNREGPLRGATDPVDADGQPTQPQSGQLAPEAPDDVFAALGLGGQVAFADPGSDTIVVRLGALSGRAQTYGMVTASRVVTEALRRP